MIHPSVFIGIGDFGSELAEQNNENYKVIFPRFSLLSELISISDDFTCNGIQKCQFSFEKSAYKKNLKTFLKQKNIVKHEINNSIDSVLQPGRYTNIINEVDSTKVSVLIYFNLGDDISSVIIQEIIELLNSTNYAQRLEIYLFAVDYDFLNDSRERAYCCLSELDYYLDDKTFVRSVTIVSKYSLNNAFPITEKKDIIYLSKEFSDIIINNNQEDVFTSALIRNNRVNTKRTLYSSFGKSSINYSRKEIWDSFSSFEMSKYLNDISDTINNIELQTFAIRNSVDYFIDDNNVKELYKNLSTDTDSISLYADFKLIASNHLSSQLDDSAQTFINSIDNISNQYEDTHWRECKVALNQNIIFEKNNRIRLFDLNLTNKINISDYTGLPSTRAFLNELLGNRDDNTGGVVIENTQSLENLEEDILGYFKHELFSRIPDEEKIDLLKELVDLKMLQSKKKEIINVEEDLTKVKNQITALDDNIRSNDIEVKLDFENGFFSIGGKQTNINGCEISNEEIQDVYSTSLSVDSFPEVIDLRSYMSSKIESQGEIGSCVTNSITSALEYISRRRTGSEFRMSRLFLYYNARISTNSEREILQDSGCNVKLALDAAKKYGVCSEEDWPYNIKNVNIKPSSDSYLQAEKVKIDKYQFINANLNDMISCLSDGYPFVFGLKIFPSFDDATGIISVPTDVDLKNLKNSGSHAMLCVGYNRVKKYFVVRNSWGVKWGDGGYCYIPFSYMTDNNLIHNICTIRSIDEKVNSIMKQNISSQNLNFFKNGNNPEAKLKLLNNDIKDFEDQYNRFTSEFNTMSDRYKRQQKYFKSVNNRNGIMNQVQTLYLNDEEITKTALLDNELKINDNKIENRVLQQKEKLFVMKFVLIPIAILFIISLLPGLSLFDLIVLPFSAIWKDPEILIKPWKTGLFWIIVPYIGWSVFKWAINYYFEYKKLKAELTFLSANKTHLQNNLIDITNNRWYFRFEYFVKTHLYEDVIKKIVIHAEDSLKYLDRFIKSIIEFSETINNKEEVDKTNITAFEKEYVEINSDISLYYENEGFDNLSLRTQFIQLPMNLMQYYNESIHNLNSFEKDICNVFHEISNKHNSTYSISNILENNYFNTRNNVDLFATYLSKFSNPILDVKSKATNNFEHFSVIFNSNDDHNDLIDKLQGSMKNVNLKPHDNKDEIIVFQFINAFPAYYIKSIASTNNLSLNLKPFYLYDGIPKLEPNNN